MDIGFGVVGAVGLGIQLAENVTKACHFLRSIQDAPEEVSRLIEDLSQLHLVLDQVCPAIEEHRQLQPESPPLEVVESALNKCRESVLRMDQMVDKLQAWFDHRGKVRRKWASLKSVLSKEALQKFSNQIRGDLQTLQLAVSVISYRLLLHTKPIGSLQTESTRAVQALSIDKDQNASKHPLPCATSAPFESCCILRYWETDYIAYKGFFGYVIVRKSTRKTFQHQQCRQKAIAVESRYLITPTFLNKTFEYLSSSSYGQVSRTLRSFPVLSYYTSPIFHLCKKGDIAGMQQAFSNREVSPFVITENGETLLHHAIQSERAEIYSMLIQIGLDPGRPDYQGRLAWHDHWGPDVEMLRIYVPCWDDVSIQDLEEYWEDGTSHLAAEFILQQTAVRNELNRTFSLIYGDVFLNNALTELGRGYTEFVPIIKHRLNDLRDRTLHVKSDMALPVTYEEHLSDLFQLTKTPEEADRAGRRWLDLLTEEGYDVAAYLRREQELQSGQLLDGFFWYHKQQIVTFNIDREPWVSWEWWIDGESPAGLVRHEFSYITFCDIFSLRNSCGDIWPFGFTERLREPIELKYSNSDVYYQKYHAWEHEQNMINTRFSRRSRKKQHKRLRASGHHKHSSMPGAWIA